MNNTRKTFLILFLGLSFVGFITLLWGYYYMFQEVSQAEGVKIEELWNKGELNEIIELTAEKLQKDSLNFQLLRYSGYAYFYLALSQIDEQERQLNLSLAIRYLRKALVAGYPNKSVSAEIYYILGKSYFHRGLPSMSLSLYHLQKSVEMSYRARDSFEFLADAYRQLGQERQSLDYFESLYRGGKTSDRFLLAYGESLIGAGENVRAEAVLKNAQKNTQNQLLVAEILLQLGQVYYNMGNWSGAKLSLEEALEKKESADAHFLLGEVYRALDQPVQARKKWRLTLELDDQYEAALRRLQE
ncbi:tetratricopeptide repeat protein [Candidatus Haliotispira prima]|uniref:Tetratricopeptide repeat protein n=1 Tax=Candidatus Haliotispira prima TaxID=3034016 RepID=A0ABY8MGX9_9SPIO|nr:tetratricopeptide repeat protein [Candidatus Haliotispira prima]